MQTDDQPNYRAGWASGCVIATEMPIYSLLGVTTMMKPVLQVGMGSSARRNLQHRRLRMPYRVINVKWEEGLLERISAWIGTTWSANGIHMMLERRQNNRVDRVTG